MASLPLTLAALATSAVPGLKVTGVAPLDPDPDYASALIDTDRGRAVVRVPRSERAEVSQSAEMLGLAALSEGMRHELGFAVPQVLGITRANDTRAVVLTLPPGHQLTPYNLANSTPLVSEVARALAAIHRLPSSPIVQGGLPSRDGRDCHLSAARTVERAEATRLLPATVLERWKRVIEHPDTWDFATTVVHGSLDTDLIYIDAVLDGDDADDDSGTPRIVGIDGWSELAVGDPAVDLAWLIDIDPELFETMLPRYARKHAGCSVPALRVRAQLYHELALAQRLLDGVERHDQGQVDATIAELDRLVDRLSTLHTVPEAHTSGGEAQAEEILSSMPEVVDRHSETAAQEALDEDRMFGLDTDFIDPLPNGEEDDDSARAEETNAPNSGEVTSGGEDEQATDVISDHDLPGDATRNEDGSETDDEPGERL